MPIIIFMGGSTNVQYNFSFHSVGSSLNVVEEHRRIFRNPTRYNRVPLHPYRRSSVRPPMWKHNFLCLGSKFTTHVPSRDDKDILSGAGLGEKRIQIGLHASASQLNDKLRMTFPKLNQAGGYELLRCLQNSRSLVRLQRPEEGFTPLTLKEEVGNVRIYIRPIRNDLSMSPVAELTQVS